MEKPFKFEILTPEGVVYAGDVTSLIAPAQYGYLGVLANHDRLMANTVPGKIRFTQRSGRAVVMRATGKGFLQVNKNNVTLLAEDVDE